MAWCHQATSHYLNQCWPRSMSPYGVTRPQWVHTRDLKKYTCKITYTSCRCQRFNALHIKTCIISICHTDLHEMPMLLKWHFSINLFLLEPLLFIIHDSVNIGIKFSGNGCCFKARCRILKPTLMHDSLQVKQGQKDEMFKGMLSSASLWDRLGLQQGDLLYPVHSANSTCSLNVAQRVLL